MELLAHLIFVGTIGCALIAVECPAGEEMPDTECLPGWVGCLDGGWMPYRGAEMPR